MSVKPFSIEEKRCPRVDNPFSRVDKRWEVSFSDYEGTLTEVVASVASTASALEEVVDLVFLAILILIRVNKFFFCNLESLYCFWFI